MIIKNAEFVTSYGLQTQLPKGTKKEIVMSEPTSKTSEMIPSMFNWITPDIQKIRAKHLDEATKRG